jgi:hypothetical protein
MLSPLAGMSPEERRAIRLDDVALNNELLRMTDAYADELFRCGGGDYHRAEKGGARPTTLIIISGKTKPLPGLPTGATTVDDERRAFTHGGSSRTVKVRWK